MKCRGEIEENVQRMLLHYKAQRKQLKAQEERRRLRKLAWLTHGGPKPEDTDED